MNSNCPVCKTEIREPEIETLPGGIFQTRYSCPRCGDFFLDEHLSMVLDDMFDDDSQKRPLLSHWIRTRYEGIRKEPSNKGGYRQKEVILDEELVNSIIKNPRPSLPEQADNYVRWIGDNVKVGGQYTVVEELAIQAIIGSATKEEFELVSGHLRDAKLIDHKSETGVWRKVTLSFAGWERYRELKSATSDSRKAFMAMQYNEKQLDDIVENVFRGAVRQTGFDLFILRDNPVAGLIDDRLRVGIRTSRFLIADLTHRNAGAYWEAGYAEGLGKPVIYTCEKRVFEDPKSKPHFDTNHHLTILWDSEKPDDVAKELKATIRATLPAEAKLTDE